MERTENSESYRRQEDPAWYRIVMLSAIAFAIEFAYSLETAYGTPVLLAEIRSGRKVRSRDVGDWSRAGYPLSGLHGLC